MTRTLLVFVAIFSLAYAYQANVTNLNGTIIMQPQVGASRTKVAAEAFSLGFVVGVVVGGVAFWLGLKAHKAYSREPLGALPRVSTVSRRRSEPVVVFEDWPNRVANSVETENRYF